MLGAVAGPTRSRHKMTLTTDSKPPCAWGFGLPFGDMRMELPCPDPSPLLVDKPRTVFNLIDVPQGFSSDAHTQIVRLFFVCSQE